MKRHLFTIVHFFILILFLIVQIDTKGGRGGGGGGRGRSSGGFRTGSRASSSGGSFAKSSNRYRSYPSYSSYNTRMNSWYSFGSGILAFSIMSNLANRGYHYRYNGRPVYSSYNKTNQTSDVYQNFDGVAKGSVCVNNQDFNGTVFGLFECPLPEFDPSARYCCGSEQEKTQFCCDYYDKFGFEQPDERTYSSNIFFGVLIRCLPLVILCWGLYYRMKLFNACCSIPTSNYFYRYANAPGNTRNQNLNLAHQQQQHTPVVRTSFKPVNLNFSNIDNYISRPGSSLPPNNRENAQLILNESSLGNPISVPEQKQLFNKDQDLYSDVEMNPPNYEEFISRKNINKSNVPDV